MEKIRNGEHVVFQDNAFRNLGEKPENPFQYALLMAVVSGEPLKMGFTGPVNTCLAEAAHSCYRLLAFFAFLRAISTDEKIFWLS